MQINFDNFQFEICMAIYRISISVSDGFEIDNIVRLFIHIQ